MQSSILEISSRPTPSWPLIRTPRRGILLWHRCELCVVLLKPVKPEAGLHTHGSWN